MTYLEDRLDKCARVVALTDRLEDKLIACGHKSRVLAATSSGTSARCSVCGDGQFYDRKRRWNGIKFDYKSDHA